MKTVRRYIAIGCVVLVAGFITGGAGPAVADEAYMQLVGGWTIEQAKYTGEVDGEVVRLMADLTVKVLSAGWQEIPLSFGNATITDLKVSGGAATIVTQNDQYAIRVQRPGTCRVTATLAIRLARDAQYEQVALQIPQAVFSTLTLTIPRTDVELAPEQALTVTKTLRGDKVTLTAALGLSRYATLRWSARPVRSDPVDPAATADVQILTTLDEETVRMMAIIGYHVLQGELKTLELTLPAGVTVSTVRGVAIEDWKVQPGEGVQRLTVTLSQPLKVGAAQLILEAEQPLGPEGGSLIVPTVVPQGVKRLTGYMAIATGTSVELRDPVMAGLRRIDVREAPSTLVRLATAPIVMAFRYQESPYTLTATLHRPQEMAVLVAIAESGDLATIVTPTGDIMTRAIYQIRNNKKSSLGVILPEGATLWSVLVDGRAVKPGVGTGRQILIPLSTARGPESTFPVEVVYVEQMPAFGWAGRARYQGPVLDVPVTVAQWHVFLPERVQPYRFSGNVERHLAFAGFLPEDSEALMIDRVGGLKVAQGGQRDDKLVLSKSAAQRQSRGNDSGYEEPGRMREIETMNASLDRPVAVASPPAIVREIAEEKAKDFRDEISRLQQTGILPFRIAIPQSGRAYQFGRLLTTGEPLTLHVQYVGFSLWPLTGLFAGTFGLAGLGQALKMARRVQ